MQLARSIQICNIILILLKLQSTAMKTESLVKAPSKETISFLINSDESYQVFHKRQKRYLLFEEGASVVFQGNIGKAILDTRPRGLNVLTEYSLVYDLPDSLNKILIKSPNKFKMKSNLTKSIIPWSNTSMNKWRTFDKLSPSWRKSLQANKNLKIIPNKDICLHKSMYTNLNKNRFNRRKWCKTFKMRKRYTEEKDEEEEYEDEEEERMLDNETFSEKLFLDLVGKLAELHGYNPRYCIMRILCESNFLLLDPGQSLLHDITRILISNSKGAFQRNKSFKNAFLQTDVNQCSLLYGPHCRISFIGLFTKIVHNI